MVEVKGPLRVKDFDALAATAHAWIESRGELSGMVIHARAFPGWENMGSLVQHIRFVLDHQRKVRRVAVAAEGRFATLAPRIAEHFVNAELKGFGFDELERAIAWAASAAAVSTPPHQR